MTGIYIFIITILLVLGLGYIYFPNAWPQLERNIILPYLLWFLSLAIFYVFLVSKRGTDILSGL